MGCRIPTFRSIEFVNQSVQKLCLCSCVLFGQFRLIFFCFFFEKICRLLKSSQKLNVVIYFTAKMWKMLFSRKTKFETNILPIFQKLWTNFVLYILLVTIINLSIFDGHKILEFYTDIVEHKITNPTMCHICHTYSVKGTAFWTKTYL